jgi:VanZ family protein
MRIPTDKKLHMIVGFAISYSIGAAFVIFKPENKFMFLIGIVIALLIGLSKEVYDYFHKATHTPDIMDALATLLGGVVASFLLWFFWSQV